MSQNLSPETALIALVLSAPSRDPRPEASDSRPYCVLMRAALALGRDGCLVDTAVSLGFSGAQALGIMRGWDLASGGRPCFDDDARANPSEVGAGEAVGRRLHALVT